MWYHLEFFQPFHDWCSGFSKFSACYQCLNVILFYCIIKVKPHVLREHINLDVLEPGHVVMDRNVSSLGIGFGGALNVLY